MLRDTNMLYVDSVGITTELFVSQQYLWLHRQQHIYKLCIFLRVWHRQSWWVHL